MKLNPLHPALAEKRSIHPKMVKDPKTATNLFKRARDNDKLGKGFDVIQKGRLAGMPMLSLTLQERATCPTTCHHWDTCFGNNMGFAHRFQHGPELEETIEAELDYLCKKHRKGLLIRLHVLGDFYSVEYVELWQQALLQYPNLHIFGYSARKDSDPIGAAIREMNLIFGRQSFIRESTNDDSKSKFIASNVPLPGSITCPQQTGDTESCLTCGFCWGTTKIAVNFLTH